MSRVEAPIEEPEIISEKVGSDGNEPIVTEEVWIAGYQPPEDLHNGNEQPSLVMYEKGWKGEPLTHLKYQGVTPIVIIEPSEDGVVRVSSKNNICKVVEKK